MKVNRSSLAALTIAAAMSLCSVGSASVPAAPVHRHGGTAVLLSAVPLNVSQTFTASVSQGYGILTLSVDHDAHVSATEIQMTCQGTIDSGTTWLDIQSCVVSAGVCISYDASFAKSVSAVKAWPWRVDVLGFQQVKCTFTSTGGAAGDTATVKARYSTK